MPTAAISYELDCDSPDEAKVAREVMVGVVMCQRISTRWVNRAVCFRDQQEKGQDEKTEQYRRHDGSLTRDVHKAVTLVVPRLLLCGRPGAA